MLESRGWGGGRDGKAEPDNSHRIDPHTFDYHITVTITITITRARQESYLIDPHTFGCPIIYHH